jgi:hypothetical protein
LSVAAALGTIEAMQAIHYILVGLISFASAAFAVFPPPDGGYPNQTTAEGEDALLNLTTGANNTALGFNALLSNTTGHENTAIGSQALTSTTTGDGNVAIGWQTLFSNEEGFLNIAIGEQALYENVSGDSNIAIGDFALHENTGDANVAIGQFTGEENTTGSLNTAVGFNTMAHNTTGKSNCAFGNVALAANTGGSNNTAIGVSALNQTFGSNNTAVGASAGFFLQGGSNNIFIGASAGSTVQGFGSNNIEIGTIGNGKDDGQIRIGKKDVHTTVHIAGIAGSTVSRGVAVMTDNLGHLGTVTSSARFKEKIKPMDQTSEAILSLKPVTFRYKKALDPEAVPQFGLVAEEVEKVDPDLVAYDDQGKPYSVRYEAVNAMLLNEFLKEHRKVEQEEATLAEQSGQIAELKAALAKQAERLDRVTALLDASN